jgi:hypothetical protein
LDISHKFLGHWKYIVSQMSDYCKVVCYSMKYLGVRDGRDELAGCLVHCIHSVPLQRYDLLSIRVAAINEATVCMYNLKHYIKENLNYIIFTKYIKVNFNTNINGNLSQYNFLACMYKRYIEANFKTNCCRKKHRKPGQNYNN